MSDTCFVHPVPIMVMPPPDGQFDLQEIQNALAGMDRGISIRTWFAGMALQGLLSAVRPEDKKYICREAWKIADVMLENAAG
jgi:hypothetical protein